MLLLDKPKHYFITFLLNILFGGEMKYYNENKWENLENISFASSLTPPHNQARLCVYFERHCRKTPLAWSRCSNSRIRGPLSVPVPEGDNTGPVSGQDWTQLTKYRAPENISSENRENWIFKGQRNRLICVFKGQVPIWNIHIRLFTSCNCCWRNRSSVLNFGLCNFAALVKFSCTILGIMITRRGY